MEAAKYLTCNEMCVKGIKQNVKVTKWSEEKFLWEALVQDNGGINVAGDSVRKLLRHTEGYKNAPPCLKTLVLSHTPIYCDVISWGMHIQRVLNSVECYKGNVCIFFILSEVRRMKYRTVVTHIISPRIRISPASSLALLYISRVYVFLHVTPAKKLLQISHLFPLAKLGRLDSSSSEKTNEINK